jgi:DNA-binding response OmpR family regulator
MALTYEKSIYVRPQRIGKSSTSIVTVGLKESARCVFSGNPEWVQVGVLAQTERNLSNIESKNRMLLVSHDQTTEVPTFGPIYLELASQTVRLKNSTRFERLSDSEYQILWLLVRAKGGLVSRDTMIEFLYGDDDERDLPLGDTLNVFLNRIKTKLARLTRAVTITTRRELGYCLVLV